MQKMRSSEGVGCCIVGGAPLSFFFDLFSAAAAENKSTPQRKRRGLAGVRRWSLFGVSLIVVENIYAKTSIFNEFWLHFGRLLVLFLEPKCNQKSSEILKAILEVKKGGGLIFWARLCGMRGVPGEPMEGYKNELRQRIPAENQGEGKALSRVV